MRRQLARRMACVLVFCSTAAVGEVEWRGLVVAPEHRCSPYDRRDYPYPQSVEEEIVAALGDIYGPYTCTRFASSRDTHIEHMVAISEAHDSGLCAQDDATRRRFASELRNLTLAGPAINLAKAAKDATDWLPEMNRCWFTGRVVEVRKAHGLSIDQREADALEAVLSRCSEGDVKTPFCARRSFFMRVLAPILRDMETSTTESP